MDSNKSALNYQLSLKKTKTYKMRNLTGYLKIISKPQGYKNNQVLTLNYYTKYL